MSSYNYNLNRDQIIYGALRLIGALDSGGTPDANQVSDAAQALNLLVMQWETEGLPLWAINKYQIPLVANQAVYPLNSTQFPKAFEVTDCVMHNNVSNTDIKMLPLSRSDYLQLGNKAATGTPTQYYLEVQNQGSNLYLYPMPTQSVAGQYVLNVWYQRPFQTFDAATDFPDMPNEFLNALKFNLAVMLAPEYGFLGSGFDRIVEIAKTLKEEAFDFNIEHVSVVFQPDHWAMWHRGY